MTFQKILKLKGESNNLNFDVSVCFRIWPETDRKSEKLPINGSTKGLILAPYNW